MTEKQTGGPAFPINANESADRCIYTGMTLRDYFAAEAMHEMTWQDKAGSAKECYEIADAMLEAREL